MSRTRSSDEDVIDECKDGDAATYCLRTLGRGAQQAAAGDAQPNIHTHVDNSHGGQLTGAALSDVTGSGTTVVLANSPTISSLRCALLYGSSTSPGGITFAANSADGLGNMNFSNPIVLAPIGVPTSSGRLQRSSNDLYWYDTAARKIAHDNTALGGDLSGTFSAATVVSASASVAGKAMFANDLEETALEALQSNDTRLLNHFIKKRQLQWYSAVGGTTGINQGHTSAPTISGTVSNVDSSSRAAIRTVTGSTSGNSAGVLSGIDVARAGWLPLAVFSDTIGNTITSYRHWIGWVSADLAGVATPTTQDVAAFSYDTGRDGTVFFRTVTCDGSTATVTATTVAVTAAQTYSFLVVVLASSVLFYIDGVLVNTHTTHLPNTGNIMGWQMTVTTLTSATRRHDPARFAGATN